MTDMLELRKQFGGHQFHMSLNLVRFPSFQNLNVLPIDLKQIQANKIETWLSDAVGLSSSEQNQIERMGDHFFKQGAMVIPGQVGLDKKYYAVKSGDNFSQVARKNNLTFEELKKLNPGINVNTVYIGQKLRIK